MGKDLYYHLSSLLNTFSVFWELSSLNFWRVPSNMPNILLFLRKNKVKVSHMHMFTLILLTLGPTQHNNPRQGTNPEYFILRQEHFISSLSELFPVFG